MANYVKKEVLGGKKQEYLEFETANTDQLKALYYGYSKQIAKINEKQLGREAALDGLLISEAASEGIILGGMLTTALGFYTMALAGGVVVPFLGLVALGGISIVAGVELAYKPCGHLRDKILTHFEEKKRAKLEAQMESVEHAMRIKSEKQSEIMEEKINDRTQTMPEKYEFKKALTQELDLRPDMSKDFLENDKTM